MPARQGSQTRTPTTNRDTGTPPPFAHLHVDLVGPLPPSRSHTYLFTIIDRTSRWPEAIPLASITTADCARALFAGWVSRFGVPVTITSDRGAQFTSALWAGLCSLLNIQHSPTTAYNPQSNGLVERFHRRLKDALRSRAAAADWHDHLPWVLLGIRTAFRFHRRRQCTARATGRPLRGGFAGSVSAGVWAAFRRRVDTLSVLNPISSRKK
jgi:transposase InsO family protein